MRFLWDYAKQVFVKRVTSAISFVALVLAIINELRTKPFVLPLWVWLAVLAVSVMVAQFLVWRDRLERFIPNEHRERLHGLLRTLMNQVLRCEGHLVYGAEPHNRRIFQAHFPELAAQLDNWDVALDRRTRSETALREAIEQEAARRGLLSGRYDGGQPLVARVTTLAIEQAQALSLNAPLELDFREEDYRGTDGYTPGPGRERQIRLGNLPVAHLPAEPANTAEDRIEKVKDEITNFARAVVESPEAVGVQNAQEALEQKIRSIRKVIFIWMDVTNFPARDECPTCQGNLGLDPGSIHLRREQRGIWNARFRKRHRYAKASYMLLASRAAVDLAAMAVLAARAWCDPRNWSDMFCTIAEATQMDVSEFIKTWETLG